MPAIALALLALMGFGSAAIFARVGMQTVGAPTVTIISLCFSFLASGILALVFAVADFGSLPPALLAWCLMLGAFNFLGGRNLSFQAIGRIGAARAGAIVGTSAVFASILAITLTGERPHWIVLAGTLVVVAGLTTALGKNLLESGRRGAASPAAAHPAAGAGRPGRAALTGYLMAFGAAGCYGTTNVVVKQLTEDVSPLVVSTISLLFGALMVAPVAGRQAAGRLREARRTPGFLFFAALSGLAAATGVNCTYFALQRAEVVIIAPIVSANPLFTLILAAIFLSRQENVTRWLAVGTAIAVAGVMLVALGSTL